MTERRKRSRKGAPGIVEVAQRAGVSPATVSRFFNSPEVVKGPTRKRIETAAAELGYIRDRMAGALHNRFSGTFGLIIPTIDNAIFAEMIEAFSSHLQSQDRTMLIASHGYDLKLETAHVRSLLERRIDGIALVGLDHDPVSLNMLAQRDVPTVTIWNYSDTTDLPNIGADNSVAGKLVAEHLLELGHTDFVTIFPETENNDRARGRFDGVMTALDKAGVQVPPENTIACGYDVGKAKEIGKNVLLRRKPSAIICGNDVLLEFGYDEIYAPIDLDIGHCRLSVAELEELSKTDDPRTWSHVRIATKYPHITSKYFADRGVQAECIKLNGAMELAPTLGLCRRIVDLVSTGDTLRANGLAEVEQIMDITSRLIVNRAAFKTRPTEIGEWIQKFEDVLNAKAS